MLSKLRTLVLIAAGLLACAAPAAAQQLQPGTRVRITLAGVHGDQPVIGTVVQGDDSRIRLRLDPTLGLGAHDTLSIPRAMVRRVEVSMGTGRARGVRAGALAGLVAGVALGVALASRDAHGGTRGLLTTAAWTAPALAVVGAGTGAMLGPGAHEQWRALPMGPSGIALGHNISVSIRLGF
jgi:hypothetical protein